MVLRKGGLIVSRRGPGGGHHLSRPAADISLGDVVAVLEGPLSVELDESPPSAHATACASALDGVWRDVGAQVQRALASVTIADLKGRVTGRSPTYQI